MSTSDSFRIRPAGRHILTIGRDLIQDSYAAVVELVKNAYDADSPDVNVEFVATPNRDGYTIVVSDHGHGMSRDTVINKWMVPSTDDKLQRRKSPAGRIMQGRKGIGRFAAAILGTDLLLETITAAGEKTTVFVEWDRFRKAQYLDSVEILIETMESTEPSGTKLTITGDARLLAGWDKDQFDKLQFELRKLISPVSAALSRAEFRIRLTFSGFPDAEDVFGETIDSFPIFEFSDYKITGKISKDGKGTLTYSSQKAQDIAEEKIPFEYKGPTGCGELDIDIRVYDRDKEAIDLLIRRGLRDSTGNYIGKLQARQLLNEYNGIGVYRNGFRIRPLGDADFDWLKLNEERVQNPSFRIGSNQVIGYVQIQSEEQSGLIEKSARDGLRENESFESLKEITKLVITRLETRRFDFRRKTDLSIVGRRVERGLARLFSFDEVKQEILTQHRKGSIDRTTADEIIEVINRDEEDKNRAVEEIRQAVALYQGQATLGKIMYVVLHEGRQPLSYFRNQIPNLRYWHESLRDNSDAEALDNIMSIADGISRNADIFVKFFRRLEPLATGRRSEKQPVNLKESIEGVLSVFQSKLNSLNVFVDVTGPDNFRFSSWPQDIYAIFTNLIDNSLYWMEEQDVCNRSILIRLVTNEDSLLHIDYSDTGPGIEPGLIESEVIFEPEFSTKPSGTGLGLAIAGEAASRNGLELKVFESEKGACFRLQPE